jgi:hypothetical protein
MNLWNCSKINQTRHDSVHWKALAASFVFRNLAAIVFALALGGIFTASKPELSFAQPDSPYSFATGKQNNIQKEENFVASASESLIAALRGKKGESLAIVSTGLALFCWLVSLKAGALVFGVIAVLCLGLSHPYLALALAVIGLAIHKYRNRDYDDEFVARPKNQEGKPGQQPNVVIQVQAPPGGPPKINRPM